MLEGSVKNIIATAAARGEQERPNRGVSQRTGNSRDELYFGFGYHLQPLFAARRRHTDSVSSRGLLLQHTVACCSAWSESLICPPLQRS